MPLYLTEVALPAQQFIEPEPLLAEIDAAVRGTRTAEVVEFQVTSDRSRIYVIVDAADSAECHVALRRALPADATVRGPDAVRLVGAELSEVKAARADAGYLVEWDLPAELRMEEYLARKKEKAPGYADVPEVSFLRTYVREDMAKCVCLYDAPEEQFVWKAREAVDTPVDRLHALRQEGEQP